MRASQPLVLLALLLAAPAAGFAQEGTQQGGGDALTLMLSSNEGLRAQGMDYVLQQIDFFHRDGARASERWFQQEFRWVAGDPRRGADGPGLSYLFDASWPAPASGGVAGAAAEAAVDRAMATWTRESCLADVPVRPVVHEGGDVTIFDFLAGAGGLGDPFAADVVVAGFPEGLAEVFGPDTLAFSVTFVFVDGSGEPTDLDGDRHLDTALNEIYLNPAVDWTAGSGAPGGGPGFDLETAALHELGHALGLGHFSPPPRSVMSPVYAGVQRGLHPIDRAALCVVHGRS